MLVPVYNELHVAEAAIRRVLSLSDPLIRDLQVIVVDDSSTDGTSEKPSSSWQQKSRVSSLFATRKTKARALPCARQLRRRQATSA